MSILDRIHSPADLRNLPRGELPALAEEMRVEVLRDGKRWTQEYRRGAPVGQVRAQGGIPEANRGLDADWKRKSGTRTYFKPDHEIFETLDFSWR